MHIPQYVADGQNRIGLVSQGSFTNLVMKSPSTEAPRPVAVGKGASWGKAGAILAQPSMNAALTGIGRSSGSIRAKVASFLTSERLHSALVVIVMIDLFAIALVRTIVFSSS